MYVGILVLRLSFLLVRVTPYSNFLEMSKYQLVTYVVTYVLFHTLSQPNKNTAKTTTGKAVIVDTIIHRDLTSCINDGRNRRQYGHLNRHDRRFAQSITSQVVTLLG